MSVRLTKNDLLAGLMKELEEMGCSMEVLVSAGTIYDMTGRWNLSEDLKGLWLALKTGVFNDQVPTDSN